MSFSPPPPFQKNYKKCYIKKNDGVKTFFFYKPDWYGKSRKYFLVFQKRTKKNEKERKRTKKERIMNEFNLKIKCFYIV